MPAGGAEFRIDSASVRYPTAIALHPADLTIAAGTSVALVGPSGAGKTTLLRLLNGTLRPDTGRVAFDDRSLGELGPRALRQVRSSIGFIHQDLGLVPNLRVVQNVALGRVGQTGLLGSLKTTLWPGRQLVEDVHALLCRVGIGEKLFERTDRLSGGQQQRVAIARALFQRPRAVLADEPVSSVDPARARDTIELLTRLSNEDGLTLCVSLHNLELAREFFPRLIGLRAGRIAFDRRADELDGSEVDALFDLDAGELLANGH